jgi:anti-sigma regulatory factor (Ser/Thr protein kinase)
MNGAAPVRDGRRDLFDHWGLLYQDAAHYVAVVTAFVRSALAAGQPALVAVPGRNLDLVREEMGQEADRVRFADMAVHGRNPRRIIGGVLLAFAAAHQGRRVAIVGEPIWPGRTDVEYPACVAHEALINQVFAGRDAEILCPYDASRLAPAALADAARTHPLMSDGARTWPSDAYGDPLRTAADAEVPLAVPPQSARLMSYVDQHDLVDVRRFVADAAHAGGLTEDQISNLIVAINEIAANTIEHTTSSGRIAAWREDGLFVCQVDDGGRLGDPLAGYVPPGPDADRGRGLVLVNQLCDLVRVHAGADGTTIRVHMSLSR